MNGFPTQTDLYTLINPDEEPNKFYKTANVFQEEWEQYPEEIRQKYEWDEETHTFHLPETEWVKWRQHGPYYEHPSHPRYIDITIGGSDIAALYEGSEFSKKLYLYEGQHGSTYKSASELYYEKIGQKFKMKEPSNAAVLTIGHLEEPSIRKIFKEMYQKDHPLSVITVENDTMLYQCGLKDKEGKLLLPFVLCNLDGTVTINGIKGVFEAKTCQFGSEDYNLWKQGIVPLKYYLQICWYMLCTNLPYAYIACKWGIGPSNFVYVYIERNFAVESELICMAKQFVACVKNAMPPKTDGQMIERLYVLWRKIMGPVKENAPTVELEPNLADVIVSLENIEGNIKKAKAELKELELKRKKLLVENVFPVFGESTYGFIRLPDGSTATIQLKTNQRVPKVVDEDALKKDFPDIYKNYVKKESSFNTSLFEKEQKLLAEKYVHCSMELTDSKMNFIKITRKGD